MWYRQRNSAERTTRIVAAHLPHALLWHSIGAAAQPAAVVDAAARPEIGAFLNLGITQTSFHSGRAAQLSGNPLGHLSAFLDIRLVVSCFRLIPLPDCSATLSMYSSCSEHTFSPIARFHQRAASTRWICGLHDTDYYCAEWCIQRR